MKKSLFTLVLLAGGVAFATAQTAKTPQKEQVKKNAVKKADNKAPKYELREKKAAPTQEAIAAEKERIRREEEK